MQQVVIIPYQRFGTTHWFPSSPPPSWPLKMGLIGCPKTSVRNYHYLLHNNPEKRGSHLLCSRSLNHAMSHLCTNQKDKANIKRLCTWNIFKTYQKLVPLIQNHLAGQSYQSSQSCPCNLREKESTHAERMNHLQAEQKLLLCHLILHIHKQIYMPQHPSKI